MLQFLTDETGQKTAVVLPLADYEKLIEDLEDVAKLNLPADEKVAFVTQSTLSVDETKEIVDALTTKFPHITKPRKQDICYATQNRQDAVKFMAPQVDLVIVVGSKASSNSNRLR